MSPRTVFPFMTSEIDDLTEEILALHPAIEAIQNEMAKAIVGQRYLIGRLLVGLLANGHVLLEGVPGLAKTATINALAQCLSTKFARVQFTPDLLPSDLVGNLIYNPREGTYFTKKGPIFANLVLADEINRAPAKVQSALLEAMQERQVTIGEETFPLPEPFLVLATQNPIDQEGTYALPEAQVDRFMLKVVVGYPQPEEEKHIMQMMAQTKKREPLKHVATPEIILDMREVVDDIYIDEQIEDYIVRLVFATREPGRYVPQMEGMIRFGASPRASINLALCARACAFLDGRGYVTPQDVKVIATDVLRHRIITTFEADADGITSEAIVGHILDQVAVP